MSYSSGTTSCLVQSAVRNISLTSGRHYPWGRLSCVWLSGELVRVGRGFMQENLLQVGPARDSNSRVPVRGADRSRHSGVGEQRGGGCRCAPATCRGGAPSGHLRRGTGEVGARKGRRWRRLGRVHGPASDALECEKRETCAWTQGAVGLVQGARGRVRSSSGPQRWIGCGVGEVRASAPGGKRGGVGPVPEPRTAVKSRGCRVMPTCR